jgi:flagellar protein FlaG
MVDQVNPMGSLAPGLPLTLLVAAKPQPVPEKPRPAKPVDPQPEGLESRDLDPSPEAVDGAAKAFQAFFDQSNAALSFQVDESSGRFYFKVVDANTQEVIRQVPSEEVLAMARKLRELTDLKGASGALVDKEG